MSHVASQFTIAVLAGGKSSRMGTDKAFVPLLGKPLIEHILARVAGLGQHQTILITNRLADYAHLELPLFTDVIPNKSALGGIYTAIYHSQTAYTLTLACDMPFVNPDLLRHMIQLCTQIEHADPFDVLVPRIKNHLEGLHAIYNCACLGAIQARITADKLKVIDLYNDVHVRYLDEPEWSPFDPLGLSFRNINTPAELAAAQKLITGDQTP